MGILNRYFGSAESIAKKAELTRESILKHWKEYKGTILKKEKVIIGMFTSDENIQNNLQELKKLLTLELVDIHDEKIEEKEIILELESIEHYKKIIRVNKLEQCLAYTGTKYEYVHELLQQLYSVLKYQMHLTEKLFAGSKDSAKLISGLNSQLDMERGIIEQIDKIQDQEAFNFALSVLIRGEHIIKIMDSKEKTLLRRIQKGMRSILSNEKTDGITYKWAITVFEAIEDKVHEEVARDLLSHHPDIDFEYVNRQEFVELARETIQNIKKGKVSEQMINVFVHIFREWYNYERK